MEIRRSEIPTDVFKTLVSLHENTADVCMTGILYYHNSVFDAHFLYYNIRNSPLFSFTIFSLYFNFNHT